MKRLHVKFFQFIDMPVVQDSCFTSVQENRENHCIVHFSFINRYMFCWSSTLWCSLLSAWPALLIWALISLSRKPPQMIMLPGYLRILIFASWVSFMVIAGAEWLVFSADLVKTDCQAKQFWSYDESIKRHVQFGLPMRYEGTIIIEEGLME